MFDLTALITKLRRNWKFIDLGIIIGFLALFITTRLINLNRLPIFTDEAIYIHWAKLAWKDASWRFVSLTDGRQPFQTWATIPFLKLIDDPLTAGRCFGIAGGLFALVGLFFLGTYLFGKKAGYLAMLLYIFNPYYLFYDRLALADSFVNGFYIWFVFFAVVLVKEQRLDLAIIFGLLAGLGTLAKSTVRVFFIPFAFAPVFYLKQKKWLQKTVNYFFLVSVAGVLSLVVYNVQRLSPFMHFIELKNTTFVKTFPELLAEPFNPLFHNLKTIPYYFLSESNYFLVLIGLLGLILLWRKNKELTFLLVMFFLTPFTAFSLMAKVVFPRYLIFLTIPFFVGFLYFFSQSKRKAWLLFAYIFLNAYFVGLVLFNPQKLPWPEIDRGQYFEGASAGHGTLEIVNLLKSETASGKEVYVFTDGTFGLLPYALDIYFPHNQTQIKFEARWPIKEDDIQYAKSLSEKYPVYFIFQEEKNLPPQNWPLQLIKKYPRYGKKSHLYFYQYQNR